MPGDKIRVVIPSRRRSKTVLRAASLFPATTVCVAESEVDAYAAALAPLGGRVSILAHPDDGRGMGWKRQWILDNVEDRTVFMIDDDVRGLRSIIGMRSRRITDPREILAVVEQCADVADELGTSCFGFAHIPDSRYVSVARPFSFTGYVNGMSMGVIGRDIEFDRNLIARADMDFSLMTLWKKRILWRDHRFAFETNSFFTAPGGAAGVRTNAVLEADTARLKRKWGDAIQFPTKRAGASKLRSVMVKVKR